MHFFHPERKMLCMKKQDVSLLFKQILRKKQKAEPTEPSGEEAQWVGAAVPHPGCREALWP